MMLGIKCVKIFIRSREYIYIYIYEEKKEFRGWFYLKIYILQTQKKRNLLCKTLLRAILLYYVYSELYSVLKMKQKNWKNLCIILPLELMAIFSDILPTQSRADSREFPDFFTICLSVCLCVSLSLSLSVYHESFLAGFLASCVCTEQI